MITAAGVAVPGSRYPEGVFLDISLRALEEAGQLELSPAFPPARPREEVTARSTLAHFLALSPVIDLQA